MNINDEYKNNFASFIITNGRPDNVVTYYHLRKRGYTGPIYLIVDDLDGTKNQYIEKYKKEVIIFDKAKIAKTVDNGDNFNNLRTTTHARNACFEIAKDLNIKYFVVLDDDYDEFCYKFNDKKYYFNKTTRNGLDNIFVAMLKFYINTNILSIAFSQHGDFIGGPGGGMCFGKGLVGLKRKCMNSFFCSTERPFEFISRLNEDVNTYITLGITGSIFFTTNQISIRQAQTQSTAGGMTDSYLDYGTYVKSFYSVMYSPSSVKVSQMGIKHKRLHHCVKWNNTTPMIVSEKFKK